MSRSSGSNNGYGAGRAPEMPHRIVLATGRAVDGAQNAQAFWPANTHKPKRSASQSLRDEIKRATDEKLGEVPKGWELDEEYRAKLRALLRRCHKPPFPSAEYRIPVKDVQPLILKMKHIQSQRIYAALNIWYQSDNTDEKGKFTIPPGMDLSEIVAREQVLSQAMADCKAEDGMFHYPANYKKAQETLTKLQRYLDKKRAVRAKDMPQHMLSGEANMVEDPRTGELMSTHLQLSNSFTREVMPTQLQHSNSWIGDQEEDESGDEDEDLVR